MKSRFLYLALVIPLLLVLAACGEIPQPPLPSSPTVAPAQAGSPTMPATEPQATAAALAPAPTSTPEATAASPVPAPTAWAPGPGMQTLLYSSSDGMHRATIDAQTLALSEAAVLPTGSYFGTYPSPDGRYIANYESYEGGIDTSVFDLALGQRVELEVDGAPMWQARFLAWTPQDDLLISSAMVGDGLWRLDIRDGTGYLYFGGGDCGNCYVSAAVSPDGQAIVYSYSESIGYGSKVWRMDPDGSNRTLLLVEPGRIVGGLTYSPDGTLIAYETIPDSAASYPTAKVWVMNPDGTGVRLLSEQAAGGRGYRPYWSPDGRFLAFTSEEGNDPDRNNIHLVEVATGAERDLLPLTGQYNYDPCWSPDGSRLVFVSDRSGSDEVWAINVDGSGLQQLTDDGQPKRYPLWLRPRWDSSFLPRIEGCLGAIGEDMTHAGQV
jgi:WD40 repeat protein